MNTREEVWLRAFQSIVQSRSILMSGKYNSNIDTSAFEVADNVLAEFDKRFPTPCPKCDGKGTRVIGGMGSPFEAVGCECRKQESEG